MQVKHILITGMTGTGKSSLAKLLSQRLLERGLQTYLYNVNKHIDADFPCSSRTENEKAFLDFMFKTRGHVFFIDEGYETIGRHAGEMTKTATRTRHLGHTVCFIGQRMTMIDINVREQATIICAFNQSKKNGVMLADTYADDLFLEVPTLPVGTFICRHTVGVPAEKVVLF